MLHEQSYIVRKQTQRKNEVIHKLIIKSCKYEVCYNYMNG